jgi:hypothetical protein
MTTASTTTLDWNAQLLEQIDFHWQRQLRPRLDGLTDAEYLWEPVAGAWNVRARAGHDRTSPGTGPFTIDFVDPAPEPAPVTTIAWRLAHLIVGVLGARNAGHFDGPPIDYPTFAYAGTAAPALGQLDAQYARWITGVRTLDSAGLARPCGPAEGPWSAAPIAALVLHINRELFHHGAEIALLRDLYAHRADR